jgi:hypothetical protein
MEDFRRVTHLWLIGGTQDIFECEIPPTDRGTTKADCHKHNLIDLTTDRVIGTVLDATADVDADGEALIATGTTTFTIADQGTLTIRGRGTIQPVKFGTPQFKWTSRGLPDQPVTPITHIAGIFPNDPRENMVLSGTGIYEGAQGRFALFGALDLSQSEQGQATFNCIYKIDLKIPRR